MTEERDKELAVLRRFRLLAAKGGMAGSVLLALTCGLLFDWVAAQGAALGGLGGTLVFWLKARTSESLFTSPEKVKRFNMLWAVLGAAVYVTVLFRAYTLDATTLHALWAAVAGLFVIRAVVLVLGATGFDMKPGNGEWNTSANE